jgi:hypothetical protein
MTPVNPWMARQLADQHHRDPREAFSAPRRRTRRLRQWKNGWWDRAASSDQVATAWSRKMPFRRDFS